MNPLFALTHETRELKTPLPQGGIVITTMTLYADGTKIAYANETDGDGIWEMYDVEWHETDWHAAQPVTRA